MALQRERQEEEEPQHRPGEPDDDEDPATTRPDVGRVTQRRHRHEEREPAEPVAGPPRDGVDADPEVGEPEQVEPAGGRDDLPVTARRHDQEGRGDHLKGADEEVQRRGGLGRDSPEQHDAVDDEHRADEEQPDVAHGCPPPTLARGRRLGSVLGKGGPGADHRVGVERDGVDVLLEEPLRKVGVV